MVAIPRPLATSRFTRARWLVLAPHADDETLGAGALVAQAAAARRLAGVVYLTDGAGSHDAGGAWLARVRRREAALAVRRLGGRDAPPPLFLDWPDAHPHQPGSAAWHVTLRRLAFAPGTTRLDPSYLPQVCAEGAPDCVDRHMSRQPWTLLLQWR